MVNKLSRLGAVGGVLAGTAAVLMPVSPASGEARPEPSVSCQMHELPLPPGTTEADITGSSPDGRTILGAASDAGASLRVVMWRDGKIVDVVKDAPGPIEDMNSHGVGVGNSVTGQPVPHPWVYENGQIRQLPDDVKVHAINDAGQLVGSRLAPTEGGPPVSVPVTWKPGSDQPTDLFPGEIREGEALDIANDGTIVGRAKTDTTQEGFVWRPDGTSGPLPRPEGMPPTTWLSAEKIAGPWVLGGGTNPAPRWNLDAGGVEQIKGVDGLDSGAINQHGAIATSDGYQPRLVVDGKVTDLPEIVDGNMHQVVSISDDGSVISGWAHHPRAFDGTPAYWTCS